MKRIRIIVPVILVMTLMISTLLLPISAAGIENNSTEPRYALEWCPECDRQTARHIRSVRDVFIVDEWILCEFNRLDFHNHEICNTYDVLECSYCGVVETNAELRIYCTMLEDYIDN